MPDTCETCETCVKLRKRLDEELNKSFSFQMDIRSALGNPDDGVPFGSIEKDARTRLPSGFEEGFS